MGSPSTVLVIDDDAAACRLMKAVFAAEGLNVVAAHTGATGLAQATSAKPDVILLDLRLGDEDGLEILARLKEKHPSLPVVMLTAHSDLKTAVKATKAGAADYLTKPVDQDEIVVVVRRVLAASVLEREVVELRGQVADGGLLSQMGNSPQVQAVAKQVDLVAASDFSVLVLGETGTGKELVANAIHTRSERRNKPFIALDCGAIPEQLLESELFGHERGAFTGADRKKEGHFQHAEGGTLFLDEVGNLPIALQAKLLRVLESRQLQPIGAAKAAPIDVRFVAATNDDLEKRVENGAFRADLFYRLSQYTINLPPLRKRPADIAHLAQRFVTEASTELRRPVLTIVPEVLAMLEHHRWPGNVRELRNVIRQAVLQATDLVIDRHAMKGLLGGRHAAHVTAPPVNSGKTLREVADEATRDAERRAICEALRTSRGNKTHAARQLQTDYKTLHMKMKLLGIRATDFNS